MNQNPKSADGLLREGLGTEAARRVLEALVAESYLKPSYLKAFDHRTESLEVQRLRSQGFKTNAIRRAIVDQFGVSPQTAYRRIEESNPE